jgi:hypothetical protein
MNIEFSLVCPSVRPQFWTEICESLSDNKLNWEIIFIGPVAPIDKLHPNARWIETKVKPSQCTHIGFMEAKGEFITLTADDAVYFSPNHKGALDNMYNFIKNFPGNLMYDKDKMAYGFRMFEDQFCAETSYTHYLISNEYNLPDNQKTCPLLYPFFVIANGVYQEIKGYDNRFIVCQAENDFLFRVMKAHGHTKNSLCPTAMVWALHDKHGNSGSFRKYHSIDSALVKALWLSFDSGETKFAQLRKDQTIYKYINDNSLLTMSQGNVGEW